MKSDVDHLSKVFEYKRDADRELCEFLVLVIGSLSRSVQELLLGQLDHINAVDVIFRSHISKTSHGLATTRISLVPDFNELCVRVASNDNWFVSYLKIATRADLEEVRNFTFTDGKLGAMTCEEIFHHVSMHSAYHRGIAWATIRQHLDTPPSLTFAAWLHKLEPQRRLAVV